MEQTDESDQRTPKQRVRKIDWKRVIHELDQLPAGTPVLVATLDQSVRTHIKSGRYAYIDPDKYEVWTVKKEGSRTLADIYMMRRP